MIYLVVKMKLHFMIIKIITKLSKHLGGWTGSGTASNILLISRVVKYFENIFPPAIVVYLYSKHYQMINIQYVFFYSLTNIKPICLKLNFCCSSVCLITRTLNLPPEILKIILSECYNLYPPPPPQPVCCDVRSRSSFFSLSNNIAQFEIPLECREQH